MFDHSRWNRALVGGTSVAILGVVFARLLVAFLPPEAINVIVAAFFSLRVAAMTIIVAVFLLRPT